MASPISVISGDHGNFGIGYGGLGANLEGDGGEATADTLKELTPDDLDVRRVRAARMDHQSTATASRVPQRIGDYQMGDAQQTNSNTSEQNRL